MELKDIIDQNYGHNYMGMTNVSIPGTEQMPVHKAYIGEHPKDIYFGKMLAITRYKDRYFTLTFNIFTPNQRPTDANRLSEIQELQKGRFGNEEFVERVETSFGHMAPRLYTPDSELDAESLALRNLCKSLKQYSVENGLCKKLRTEYTKAAASRNRDTRDLDAAFSDITSSDNPNLSDPSPDV